MSGCADSGEAVPGYGESNRSSIASLVDDISQHADTLARYSKDTEEMLGGSREGLEREDGRTLRNTCIVVGILSILSDAAAVPFNALLGIIGPPSGVFTFAPLLWPFNPPVLNIIGMVLGLAVIPSALASERGASVLASIASGFALTFLTSWGSFTFGHFDVGWPLAWAHQFTSLDGLPSLPMFYLDVAGLVFDLAFWAISVGVALCLLRLYLHR